MTSRAQTFPSIAPAGRHHARDLSSSTTDPQQFSKRVASSFVIACLALLTGYVMPCRALASGGLSKKQARSLIAKMPGVALKSGAVNVSRVSVVDSTTAEAAAQITTAFRLERETNANWHTVEVRTGQDQWEEIEFIVRALKAQAETPTEATACEQTEPARLKVSGAEPGVKLARCLLARLLGIAQPSDAVRIKDLSATSLPFSSKPSALVEAVITIDFRFTKAPKGSWQIAAVRTGSRDWVDPAAVLSAVDAEKTARTRLDMQAIVTALEEFRVKRGFYVETDSEAILIDFLSPDYLSRVIRLDPWRRPYGYEGTRDHFTLRSAGPDRKENTPDDIVLTSPQRSATR